jgi:hypothetical protein
VTLLFADLVGSTELGSRLGVVATLVRRLGARQRDGDPGRGSWRYEACGGGEEPGSAEHIAEGQGTLSAH